MVDHISKIKRSWNMSRIRSVNTKPEIIVRSILHKMGYRFRLHQKKLPGKPDIVLPKYKIVILVHGCFWHRHNNCKRCTIPTTNQEYWLPKFERNIAKDKMNRKNLIKAGYIPIIIWECEIKKPEKLSKKIDKIIKAHL